MWEISRTNKTGGGSGGGGGSGNAAAPTALLNSANSTNATAIGLPEKNGLLKLFLGARAARVGRLARFAVLLRNRKWASYGTMAALYTPNLHFWEL